MVAHHGNEQIRNVGCTHVAKPRDLLTIDLIKQQDGSAEHLALVNRLERLGCGDSLRMDHHFHIARFRIFHAAFENDATAVDEDIRIREHVLNVLPPDA